MEAVQTENILIWVQSFNISGEVSRTTYFSDSLRGSATTFLDRVSTNQLCCPSQSVVRKTIPGFNNFLIGHGIDFKNY